MVLTKVAHNDAKSLNKIGCIFPHHPGGGGVRPWCGKFHKIYIFLTLYPSLNFLIIISNTAHSSFVLNLDIMYLFKSIKSPREVEAVVVAVVVVVVMVEEVEVEPII